MPLSRADIVMAMADHFRKTVEEHAGEPFEQTKVHLPLASFERYADAIMARQEPARPICHECGQPDELCGCMPF